MRKEKFHSPRMGRVEHIHFVGIGGSGMCGIAQVLHNEGYRVTGSDVAESKTIELLRSLGIAIKIGHAAANIVESDVVVRSTAIADDNAEIMAAAANRIPVIPRAMMLAELMRFRHGIAIAGTHGKTTTTSLVSSILAEGGLDPSFIIGGKLNSCGTNAQLGNSMYLVAEADESDASFLFLKPMMAVVTNIDNDHMSTYGNDFNKLLNTFVEFLHHLPFYGLAVLCIDDANVRSIVSQVQRPTITYGFTDDAQYIARDWRQINLISEFTVVRPEPYAPLTIKLKAPGRHNVLNAVAAIAIATELGVNDTAIANALSAFEGVGRRFQLLGTRQFMHGEALIIDDYGHHPQEIAATIAAFRSVWPDRRLIHVFQPHRYSRTQDLFQQFVTTLASADELLLLDIYPAGEASIPGVSSEALVAALQAQNTKVRLVHEHNLVANLDIIVKDGDAILMQGAGNVGQMALNLIKNPTARCDASTART